ncbi:MAG: class I SAM-dependent methyltransferase [Bacilli bacterium]|nr:class I SAM-dependent methyltransferase [Bacilli bacterium]
MKINNRLKAISNYIEDNSNIIDVGCDHSLLGIYLCLNRNNIKVIASDINKNPLIQAKANIEKYNLYDKIEVKLGNGIDTIDEKTDTIVISGMGGKTIIDILNDKRKIKNINKIVLSPNNDINLVRKHLIKMKYYISNEELIKEKGIVYTILEFKKGKKRYNKLEILYGPILIKNKEQLFLELIENEKKRLKEIHKMIPKNQIIKRYKLKREIKLINKI